MGSDNSCIARLEEARTILLAERRRLAESMIEFAGAASAVQGPLFVRAQEAIEAIDRAIADEQRLHDRNASEMPNQALAVPPAAVARSGEAANRPRS